MIKKYQTNYESLFRCKEISFLKETRHLFRFSFVLIICIANKVLYLVVVDIKSVKTT